MSKLLQILNKYLNFNYSFNFFLLLWVVSIPFKNIFYQSSTILLILIFVTYIIKNKDFNYIKQIILLHKDITFAFLLILASMTVSNFINDVSATNAWHLEFSYIYRYALILLILFYFYSKDFFDKNLLITFILVSLGLQVFGGVCQELIGHDIFGNEKGDLNGWRGVVFNRNVFGLLMGFGILISFLIIRFYSKINFKSSILSIFLFLFIIATLFSYSRAVWVSLVITAIIFIICNFKNFNKFDLVYFLIIIVIGIIVFFNVDSLQNRFIALVNANPSHRDEIWWQSFELFKQKLFFGWGLNAWSVHGLKEYANVHNSILEILVSLGIFGFISFSYFLYLVFSEIKRSKNLNAFYLLIFVITDTQFDQSIVSSKILLSCIVILIFYIYCDRNYNKFTKEIVK